MAELEQFDDSDVGEVTEVLIQNVIRCSAVKLRQAVGK